MLLKSVLAVVILAASPAMADDYIGFRSPTGNIQCGIYLSDAGTTARCDVTQLTPSYTRRPASCDADWGFAFGLEDQGKGYLACVSDAIGDPLNMVLPYGKAVNFGGISCASARKGMTCTNADGHGFTVSKARQKVF